MASGSAATLMICFRAAVLRHLAGLLAVFAAVALGSEPNPPQWPSTVQVFSPEQNPADIEAAVEKAYAVNGGYKPPNHGEFSSSRFAFLFRPGSYKVDVPVGYYTQVLGLGEKPDDVVFSSGKGVYCEMSNHDDLSGALQTFWRGAENFRTRAPKMLWATSQASPMRRTIVDGDLDLSEYVDGVGEGYASGGFLANVQVKGLTQAASQQQYCMRNTAMLGDMTGGVWNMVYVGSMGVPGGHCGRSSGMAATVTVDRTPVVAEKPFISIDEEGRYFLRIPELRKNSVGVDFGAGQKVDFGQVYVATASDSAGAINAKLQEGLHVVLTPGIYHLDAALEMQKEDQVMLGIGLPTLVATSGNAAIKVGNVDGVHLAGILLQAGEGETDALLQWGNGTYFAGSPAKPGLLHDIFVRVGGPNNPAETQVQAKVMARIESGNVVGDNLWLWRADHHVAGETTDGANRCDNGLVVNGDNVTMYGLAVEHSLHDLVFWAGDGGEVFFYQSELPYDVSPSFGEAGYAGFRVNDSVQSFKGYGMGVYHYFRDHAVQVKSGIVTPPWIANSIESPLSVHLEGQGEVQHVVNDRGEATRQGTQQVQWSCEKGPDVAAPTSRTTSTRTTTTTSTRTTTTSRTTTSTISTTKTVTRTTTTTTATTTTITGTTTTTTTATKTTTSTTATKTSSTTTSTATRTKSSTTTTTTTTTVTGTTTTVTTTTTENLFGFLRLSGSDSSAMPWIFLAAGVQACILFAIITLVCCRKHKRSQQPPSSQALPLHQVGSPSPLRSAGADPLGDISPAHSRASGRSQTLAKVASQSLLGRINSYKDRVPGLRNARTLSMSSLDLSGLSSPGDAGRGASSPLCRSPELRRSNMA